MPVNEDEKNAVREEKANINKDSQGQLPCSVLSMRNNISPIYVLYRDDAVSSCSLVLFVQSSAEFEPVVRNWLVVCVRWLSCELRTSMSYESNRCLVVQNTETRFHVLAIHSIISCHLMTLNCEPCFTCIASCDRNRRCMWDDEPIIMPSHLVIY